MASLALALTASLAVAMSAGEAAPRDRAAELVERERIRSTVQEAFTAVGAARGQRVPSYDAREAGITAMAELGRAAVPYVSSQLDSPEPWRYFFAVYALGRLGFDSAQPDILRAIERADEEGGKLGRSKKAWGAFALAMLGNAESVDLLDRGKTLAARSEMYRRMSALDAVALLTAPESTSRLIAQLERYQGKEGLDERRPLVVRALRRVGSRAALEPAKRLLGESYSWLREEALSLLGSLGGPSTSAPLLAALEDENPRLRRAAADALSHLRPDGTVARMRERLETEEQAFIRGIYYATLAEELGADALVILRDAASRPKADERMRAARALGSLEDVKALPLLRVLLRDPSSAVRLQAVYAVRRIGGVPARDTLLAALRDPDWPVRLTVAELLTEAREPRAAPRIADMLLNDVLPIHDGSGASRTRVQKLGQALVDLRYPAPLGELREAVAKLTDIEAKSFLEHHVLPGLATIERLGDDLERWIEAASDADAELRRLAYNALASFAGERSLDTLLSRFDRVDDDERLALLEALARCASPRAAGLIERVLTESEFDPLARASLRDAAAWAARRIGGPKMIQALRASALRRDGQDYKVLAYLAVLEGPAAEATLRAVFVPRLRYPRWDRGMEQEKLEWMLRRLAAGRHVRELDLPPSYLFFDG